MRRGEGNLQEVQTNKNAASNRGPLLSSLHSTYARHRTTKSTQMYCVMISRDADGLPCMCVLTFRRTAALKKDLTQSPPQTGESSTGVNRKKVSRTLRKWAAIDITQKDVESVNMERVVPKMTLCNRVLTPFFLWEGQIGTGREGTGYSME